jgi:hypothetical protein
MSATRPTIVDSTLDAVVLTTLHAAGRRPATYQWALIVETIEEDGTAPTPLLLGPGELSQYSIRELVVDTAEELSVRGFRCICGASSPTPQCPDFPDCLPGGGS